jgi:predicted N-acetyltransferase YhbS
VIVRRERPADHDAVRRVHRAAFRVDPVTGRTREATDERLVALLGAPAYYRRFGFVPAAEVGVASPDPAWGEHFQARRLRDVPTGGRFRYAEPFRR